MQGRLVGHAGGKSYEVDGFDPGDPKTAKRWASRYWPTEKLLQLAEGHSLTPANAREAFRNVPPTKAPVVKSPVELRALGTDRRDPGARRVIPVQSADAKAAKIRADVEAHNDLAARWNVEGCTPPRWKRVFYGDWTLHGRWYAVGSDGAYQTMPGHERKADVRLNGETVVEVDIRAAHLSILAALSGLAPATDDDPYDVPGFPGDVVKRWIVASLGKGSPVTRTPRGAAGVFAGFDLPKLSAAIVARHPVLQAPAKVVPPALVERHGDARRLLTHYLSGIEAKAMTDAMHVLREVHGVLSLPVHDSLIVPLSAELVARCVLTDAFERRAGFAPRLA